MSQVARIFQSGDLNPNWVHVEQQLAGDRFIVNKCSGTPEETLAWCCRLAPCVLVVDDAFINKVNPDEFCETVSFGRSIRVLVETENQNCSQAERLIRMGCAGVLSRNASPATACRALLTILAGELWADRKALSRIVQDLLRAMKYRLTFRETEILGLVGEGLKNSQIAERLFISPQTVRWHLRAIYTKLGTHDRFCAASHASLPWEQESPRRNRRRPAENAAATAAPSQTDPPHASSMVSLTASPKLPPRSLNSTPEETRQRLAG